MGQPHLGSRRLFIVYGVPATVDVEQLAHQARYSKVSRFGADLLCDLAGRDDLKLGTDVALPLSALPLPFSHRVAAGNRRAHKYTIRIPDSVDAEAVATAAGYSSVSRFVRDKFCELAGRSDLKLGADASVEGGRQLPLTA